MEHGGLTEKKHGFWLLIYSLPIFPCGCSNPFCVGVLGVKVYGHMLPPKPAELPPNDPEEVLSSLAQTPPVHC